MRAVIKKCFGSSLLMVNVFRSTMGRLGHLSVVLSYFDRVLVLLKLNNPGYLLVFG